MIFLWLRNVELAIFRVKERIRSGGHSVPEETIRRRYTSDIKNFFNLYSPLADSWQVYDNSDANQLALIASKIEQNDVIINSSKLWENLLEISNEKN